MQRFSPTFPHIRLPFKFRWTSRTQFCSTISCHIKSHRLDDARRIFDKIRCPNAHLYTKMINGYMRNYRLNDAFQLFDEMPVRDVVAWNSMIKGCVDCGELVKARELFDRMPERNVVSSTTMVNGYMKFGKVEVAEELFREMGFRDVAAWNAMIHGYFVNGRVDEAMKVFEEMPSKNVISWTAMISGLDQNGRSFEAFRLSKRMIGSGIEPTASTFSCLITACVNVMVVELGTQFHGRIVKLGYIWDEFVASSLITLYANCKRLEDSCRVFREKVHDSVVVWTSLLTGYSLNSMHDDALTVFRDMTKLGISPNESSFTSALNSCCAMVSLDKGRVIHGNTIKLGFDASGFVGNSLVTLYSKCGNIQEAVKSFEGIKAKNLVSWNSIIVGCGHHGRSMWALIFFARMIRFEVEPDEISLTGLLHCASHSGMFIKGRGIFMYFCKKLPTKVNLQHYACMVDIICRSGNLEEAEEFVKNMPIKPNSLVLLELLSACRVHSNIEIAERVSKQILLLDPQFTAAYTLLSNLYASAGRWDDVTRIRSEMIKRNITKQGGHSWIDKGGEKLAVLSGQ
ncbi:pentatricopeptide repeat-containing protein At5g46460, mitochondrial [Silene latifolia]|uniref:pentatricopeptide repeat-containing protein At5g46460, mitochondrial n=1 Tax=Silene latifolia TaxID=37657 RepID=UPI003D77D45F